MWALRLHICSIYVCVWRCVYRLTLRSFLSIYIYVSMNFSPYGLLYVYRDIRDTPARKPQPRNPCHYVEISFCALQRKDVHLSVSRSQPLRCRYANTYAYTKMFIHEYIYIISERVCRWKSTFFYLLGSRGGFGVERHDM